MLKKLYVNNYKSLVNFEFFPGAIQLVIGANGSGKSTVFESLSLLREFLVEGVPTTDLFPTRTLTRSQGFDLQNFGLEVEGNGGSYVYRLHVEHWRDRQESQVHAEELIFNGIPLFSFTAGEARFFREDGAVSSPFPLSQKRSGLAGLAPRPGNHRLIWFKNWMERSCFLRVQPDRITSISLREYPRLTTDASNFASWFRHLVLERPGPVHSLFKSLQDVIDGFDEMKLVKVGETARVLKIIAESETVGGLRRPAIEFGFDELSDGQRVLIVLYTLLHCAIDEGSCLWIDDPMSHVALAEIQPLLNLLSERVEDCGSQVLLISHHPELIDFFAPDRVVQFRRPRNGPVRVRPLTIETETGLSPSEVIARGWEDE